MLREIWHVNLLFVNMGNIFAKFNGCIQLFSKIQEAWSKERRSWFCWL